MHTFNMVEQSSIMSPAKFFKQRFVDRPTDTISTTGAFSFVGRYNPLLSDPDDGSFWSYSHVYFPPVTEFGFVKGTQRVDSILFSELRVPKDSVILGAYVQLKTHPTTVPVDNAVLFPSLPFSQLDVALYPERSDYDNWRGFQPTKASSGYEWRHVGIQERQTTNPKISNGPNCWFNIREVSTSKGATPVVAGASATAGSIFIGRNATDQSTGASMPSVRSYGNVVLIDASSTGITNILTRVQRVGTFSVNVNMVCRVYNYNVTNRTKGALRATSNVVLAGGITTSATTQTTFTFGTTFAVTAGEYVLVCIEPQTNWNTTNTAYLQGKYRNVMDNGAGNNPVGGEEIIWWEPLNNGNSNVYFFTASIPRLYIDAVGVTVEDYPFNGVIERCTFNSPIVSAATTHRLYFTPRMIKTLQNYNNGHNDVGGVQIYMASAEIASWRVEWDASISANNGLFVVYRPTRTFIT